MDRLQRAQELTELAKGKYLLIGRTWVELAAIFKEMSEDRYYVDLGFKSFGGWLEKVCDRAESQAYEMIKTYRELSKTIPESAIAQMTMANARDLARIPERDRTPEMVEAGTRLINNQYRDMLSKAKPGITLEQRSYKGFVLEASMLTLTDKVLECIRQKEELASDTLAFEWLIADYAVREGIIEVRPNTGERVVMSEAGQPRVQ